MKNGIHGAYNLYTDTPQSIAQCLTDNLATVTVNICNRGTVPATVRLGFTDAESTFDVGTGWIEYDIEIPARGVIERAGLVIPTGYYLTAQASTDNVSAQAWGFSAGTELAVLETLTPIAINVPVIANGALTEVDISLGSVGTTYTLFSGTLPTGLSLSSAGVISGTMATTGYNPAGVSSSVIIRSNTGGTIVDRDYNIIKYWADGSTPRLAAASAKDAADLITIGGPAEIWIDPELTRKPFKIYAASSLSELMTIPASASRPAWVTNISGLNIISSSVVDQMDTMIIDISKYHRLIRELFDPLVDSGTTPYFYWAVENTSTNTLIGITRTRFYNTDYEGWEYHHSFGDNPSSLAPYGGTIVPEWSVWGTTGLPSGTEYVVTDATAEHVRSIPYRSNSEGYGTAGSYGLHYKRTGDGEHYPWRNQYDVNTSEGYFLPSSTNSLAGVANLRHYIFVSQT